MKTVEYVTDAKVNLGRFGELTKGQKIEVTESEFVGIANDARFKHHPTKHSEDTLTAARSAMPYSTSKLDLRTIPWGHERLFLVLQSRYGVRKLNAIIEALREVGAPVRDVNPYDQSIVLVDTIVECASLCGWTSLTKDKINALTTIEDAKKRVPQKEKESSGDKPKNGKPKTATKAARKRKRRTPSKKK